MTTLRETEMRNELKKLREQIRTLESELAMITGHVIGCR
jgi:hypothetical protein